MILTLRRTLPLVLACALCLGVAQVIASQQMDAASASTIHLMGWQDVAVWNFDDPLDVEDWVRRDESDQDGGVYLWADSTYTYTTGTQSAGPWSEVVTGTAGTNSPPYTAHLPYPDNLDTWMIYSFTVPVSDVYHVRLVFDWWMDAAPGDTFSWLTSTTGADVSDFKQVETRSEGPGQWHSGETVLLDTNGRTGAFYVAFQFQSNDDGQSGLGVFVDQIRLQYNYGYDTYLPVLLRRWPPYPSTPYLYEISKDTLETSYGLDWSILPYDTSEIFALAESTSPDFSDSITYTTPTTSHQATDKGIGVYYYRVRGENDWGKSTWSNARSTTVLSRHDDFDDPITGWTTRRTSSPDLGLTAASYQDGKLTTALRDRFDFAIFSPMFEAPPTPYSIRVRTRIEHFANEVSYGIVFGGHQGTFCSVDRSNGSDPDGCFSHYYRLNVIWGGYLKCQVKRIDRHSAEKGTGRGSELMSYRDVSDRTDDDGWNEWEIRVYDDRFELYVNGRFLEDFDDTTYIHDPLYGIFTSTYEYNSASFEHKYFYADPFQASDMLPEVGYLAPSGIKLVQPSVTIEAIK